MFAESNAITNDLFKDNFNLFIGELKLLSGNEIYIDKLEKMKTRIVELGAKLYAPNKGDDGYNVLNHGDFHNKNVMVTREDGKINDLILVRDVFLHLFSSIIIPLILPAGLSNLCLCLSRNRYYIWPLHDDRL